MQSPTFKRYTRLTSTSANLSSIRFTHLRLQRIEPFLTTRLTSRFPLGFASAGNREAARDNFRVAVVRLNQQPSHRSIGKHWPTRY